jgi:hypothetical protein
MLFVFSILGVALFGEVAWSSQLTSDNNFTTVFQAIRVNLKVMSLLSTIDGPNFFHSC